MQTFITFDTNDDEKIIRLETTYVVQDYFTFVLQVCSGPFQGKSSFCVSRTQLEAFSERVAKMNNDLRGQAVLNDNDSDAFLTLESVDHGQIVVTGQVGGSHEQQFMRFRFETDQTILHPLQRQVDQVLTDPCSPA